MGVKTEGLSADIPLEGTSVARVEGLSADVVLVGNNTLRVPAISADVVLQTAEGLLQLHALSADIILVESELEPGHNPLHGYDFERLTGESMKKER